MPSINALQVELGGDGLTVLLVDIGEPRDTVARVVGSRSYAARVLLDPDGSAMEAYRISGTPTVYLVGRDGSVLGRAIGPRPWARPSGRALLEALLKPAAGPAR